MNGEARKIGSLAALYRDSLALLTDLYQLTMAFAYWKEGLAERKAAFHLSFRRAPFQNGFAVAAGLAQAIEFLQSFRFTSADLAYLAQLEGATQERLFPAGFLEYLSQLEFRCDVLAVPEGTILFSQEPLLRVQGPLLQCQLVETALLNILNFQTLIATKAARICQSAAPQSVVEFGLRRAQGIDGGISASRAAYIGGCESTSNVLAGKLFGIPVRGTHAHSWVLAFDSEKEAFEAYARALPGNSLFLVDTYDTLEGVARAIEVGRWLRQQGHQLLGIRLDSGDLAQLSKESRRMLDQAGFQGAVIAASNDLDERKIEQLKRAGAPIAVWGVGTRLATGFDEPALGGVYKMTAIQDSDGCWQHKLKRSERAGKSNLPGLLQVRRFRGADRSMIGDLIYDELLAEPDSIDSIPDGSIPGSFEDLLRKVVTEGNICYDFPSLEESRNLCQRQLESLGSGLKTLQGEAYPVKLEAQLERRRQQLLQKATCSSTSLPSRS